MLLLLEILLFKLQLLLLLLLPVTPTIDADSERILALSVQSFCCCFCCSSSELALFVAVVFERESLCTRDFSLPFVLILVVLFVVLLLLGVVEVVDTLAVELAAAELLDDGDEEIVDDEVTVELFADLSSKCGKMEDNRVLRSSNATTFITIIHELESSRSALFLPNTMQIIHWFSSLRLSGYVSRSS